MRTHTYVEHALAENGRKRWKATCPVCGYSTTRAKREAAEHVLSMHRAYSDRCAE